MLCRVGYGVLKLKPWELFALTPGELFDMLEATRWFHAERQKHMAPQQTDAEKWDLLETKLNGQHR